MTSDRCRSLTATVVAHDRFCSTACYHLVITTFAALPDIETYLSHMELHRLQSSGVRHFSSKTVCGIVI